MLLKTGRITPKIAAGGLGVFLLIGTALTIHGMDRVNTRLNTIWTELADIVSIEKEASFGGRREVWQAAMETTLTFRFLAQALEAMLRLPKPTCRQLTNVICTHAENSYLNLGVETGLLGLGIVITALVIGFICCIVLFLKVRPKSR